MPSISSNVGGFILDQYVNEYKLATFHCVTLPSSSSSLLEALIGKIGFYLRYLIYRLRLPATSLFLEVLCLYGIHLIQLSPNGVSKVITFYLFYVSSYIPLKVSLFLHLYRLKKYGDWYSFSSHHFLLVYALPGTNSGRKEKFCWVVSSSVCLTNVPGSSPDSDNDAPLALSLYKYLPLF
ncbi:unnamed protein product [Lactuca virosa]|uniref:Transposase (putative) gypsy type domain-containing protein n=1 Tax=Lactuca virosa TaxID=75947 RepID=A0AAU9N2M5_9ASTR|nr:unnamed protein product [Lactuca virosa]